jgi:hypothetical protein
MISLTVGPLSKSAHFLVVNHKDSCKHLAAVYVNEIVSKHIVPKRIVSDRGSVLTLGSRIAKMVGFQAKPEREEDAQEPLPNSQPIMKLPHGKAGSHYSGGIIRTRPLTKFVGSIL